MYHPSVTVELTASYFHLGPFAKEALLRERVFPPGQWVTLAQTDGFEDQK